jgi:RNA polymerase sigma-70 factor, ECF subfamily
MKFRVQRGREWELIAAVLAGELHLYHELIRPYERTVYMLSLFYMKNEKDAEEIAQETFIRAFRDLSTFREDSKFSAWLTSIAISEARSRLWRAMTIRTSSLSEPQGREMSAAREHSYAVGESFLLGMAEREEITSLLQQAVERLPRILPARASASACRRTQSERYDAGPGHQHLAGENHLGPGWNDVAKTPGAKVEGTQQRVEEDGPRGHECKYTWS